MDLNKLILHALIWTLLIALASEGMPWSFPRQGASWIQSIDQRPPNERTSPGKE